MGDAELIKRIRAGETALFSRLVASYAGLVWATCSSYIDNPVDREDVVQEIFTKCYLNLDTLKDSSSFAPWLHTVARRQCLDWLRSHKRARSALERLQRETDAAPAQEAKPSRDELHRTIRGLIGALPPKTREAMLLHYAEGYSMSEGARILGTSAEAFKKRIQYGRRVLADQLSDELSPALKKERHGEGLARAIVAGVPLGQAPWLARSAPVAAAPSAGIGLGAGMMKFAVAAGALVVVAGLVVSSGWMFSPDESSQPANPPAAVIPLEEAAAPALVAPEATSEIPFPDFQEATPATTEITPKGPGVVRGLVLDPSDRAVANAQVTLVPNPYLRSQKARQRWTVETTTNEGGKFMLTGLELSRYTLVVRSGDWMGRTLFALNGVYADFVVALAPGEYATGQVVDGEGQPVEGANVSVAGFLANGRYVHVTHDFGVVGSNHSTRLHLSGIYSATTDAGGRFILGPLPAERFVLRTSGAGFAADVSDPLPAGAREVRIVLGEGGRLAGRAVHHEDGAPLPDASLLLVGLQHTETYQTRSDESGNFAIKHLRAGTYEVFTEHGDHRVVAAADGVFAEVSAGEAAFVEVPLAEGGRVRGRVIDAGRGKLVEGAHLEIISRDQFGIGDWSVRTDESGYYEFRGLRPGKYQINLWGSPNRNEYDMRKYREVLVGLGGQIDALDFFATSTDSISGRVVGPSGEGIATAYVYARWPDEKNAQAVSRADGSFTLEGIPPGTEVVLEAEMDGLISEAPIEVVAGRKDEILVTLVDGGIVEGVVQSRGGATPHSEARVFIEGEGLPVYGKSVTCSRGGRFRLGSLRAGNYAIRAEDGPAIDIEARAGSVTAGLVLESDMDGASEEESPMAMARQSGIALAGTVTDRSGNPVAGVEVAVGYESFAKVLTDAEGNFEVFGFADESREIYDAYRPGFFGLSNRKPQPLPFGTTNLALVIDRMGSVTGRVIDLETGAPIPEFEIALALEGDGDLMTAKGQYAQWATGGSPDGVFWAEFKRDQTYPVVLYARAPGYQTFSTKIGKIGPNIHLEDITVALKPGGKVEGMVTASDGTPVAGAEIFAGELDPSDMLHGIYPMAASGPDGSYLIGSMPPGACKVSVIHPDFEQSNLSISTKKSGVTRKDIRLGRGAVISGVVTRAGDPLSGGYFSVKVEEEFGERTFNIDAEGNFIASRLPPGLVRLRVSGYEQDVQLAANETRVMAIDLPEATGQISGSLLLDGEILADQSISCRITFPMPEGTYHVSTRCKEGTYVLNDVPAGIGEVHVVAHLPEGSVEKLIPVEIAEGELLQLDIDLADAEPFGTNPR